MSLEATLERVSAIRQALADPAVLLGTGTGVSGGTQAPASTGSAPAGETSFAAALEQASGGVEGSQPEAAAASAATLAGAGLATGAGLASGTGLATGTGLASGAGLASGTGLSSPGLAGSSASDASLSSPYFLQRLDGVAGSSAASATSLAGGSTGSRIVQIAESQIGQEEQPPGTNSNEGPAIAMYRSATTGAIPGAPWCAYFASWVARQAGEPIGEGGQGAGAVSEVWSWAQSTGRAITNGPGVVPKPGDLIVFGDEHVGIVRDVLPDGDIQTIEGNYENKVAANVRTPTEATGYVEMS